MNRLLALVVCVIAVVAGWMAYSRVSSASADVSASLAPKIEGSKIYFVPIGSFPSEEIEPLVRYYHEKYKLEITIAKRIPVDPATSDDSRHQLIAEKLAASLRNLSEYANDPNAVLIGFTSEDIYPMSQNWQFAFGWRLGSAGAAVVSTARMSLHYDGEPSGIDLPERRLRKVVTKDIGILYYGLSQSQNPRSVLYSQILGIEELDQVGDDF
jgi:predicted Zn-dependent protease